MLTREGKESKPEMRVLPFLHRKETEPMDRPSLFVQLRGGGSDIILRLTDHHAGLTGGTFIEINHHSPPSHNLLLVRAG